MKKKQGKTHLLIEAFFRYWFVIINTCTLYIYSAHVIGHNKYVNVGLLKWASSLSRGI